MSSPGQAGGAAGVGKGRAGQLGRGSGTVLPLPAARVPGTQPGPRGPLTGPSPQPVRVGVAPPLCGCRGSAPEGKLPHRQAPSPEGLTTEDRGHDRVVCVCVCVKRWQQQAQKGSQIK